MNSDTANHCSKASFFVGLVDTLKNSGS